MIFIVETMSTADDSGEYPSVVVLPHNTRSRGTTIHPMTRPSGLRGDDSTLQASTTVGKALLIQAEVELPSRCCAVFYILH